MSKLLGMTQIARKQLGMNEDEYRAFLQGSIGKTTLKGSSSKEQWRVIEAFKALGWQPASVHKGKPLEKDPQARLIRHLWLTMADLGIVRERSEKALNTYVRRITGCGLDKATTKQCQLVIETLKKWLDRIPDIEIQKQCLVVLRGADSAPQTIGSSVVTEAQYGHPQ